MFNPKNRSMVMNMYRDSGVAKLSLVCSLARSLIRQRVKIIVFAHHQIVLDGLCVVVEEEIQRLNLSNKQQHSPSSTRNPRKDANAATRTSTDTTTETVGDYMNAKTNTKACANTTDIIPTATDTRLPYSYIRIDGKTTSKARSNHVRSFQQQPSCVAAVLSITAAGQGITLTAACTVVFAELYWNPGHLLQAEDRVHRLGQRDVTKVHYVLGKETIDDIMWPLVSKKLGVINASVSGVQNAELRAVVLGNKDVLPYLTGGGGKGIQASRDGCSKRDETSDQVDGDGDSDGDGNSTDGNNDDSEDDKDDSEYDDDARVDTRKVGDNANESSGNRGRDRKSEKGSAANKASACGGMSSIVSILGNPLPQKRKQEPVLSLIEKLRKSRQRLVHSDSDTD